VGFACQPLQAKAGGHWLRYLIINYYLIDNYHLV
jgi:hypothetical protein